MPGNPWLCAGEVLISRECQLNKTGGDDTWSQRITSEIFRSTSPQRDIAFFAALSKQADICRNVLAIKMVILHLTLLSGRWMNFFLGAHLYPHLAVLPGSVKDSFV